jgi:predicted enzyme related to lactoylglutathione lyase
MAKHAVIHFEIITNNAEALGAFYKDAFEWDIAGFGADAMGGVKYLVARPYGTDDPEHGINGGIGERPPGYDGHVTFYIRVDDVGEMLERIEKLGGTRIMGPEKIPGMTLGLFRDPQGHTIGLVDPEM